MKRVIIFAGLLVTIPNVRAHEDKQNSTEDYIEMWKITAIEQMNQFAIPASITLAQGILESGNGNSRLAKYANNHFGIKCHEWDGATFYQDDDKKNECFRSYDNASQSYDDHSIFLTTRNRYSDLFKLKLTDYKGWAKGLKSAGYATNPKYANLLIDIIEKYNLHEYDLMPYLPNNQKEEELVAVAEEPVNEVLSPEPTVAKEIELNESKHKVLTNKNGSRYIVVHKGDTFYRIAQEFNLGYWQLYKYNELGQRDVLQEGEVIYLDPKRGRAKRGYEVHVCEKDMTLREISQIEGVKLRKLKKFNLSENADEILPAGTKVILR